MPDYKQMYLTLFRATEQAINTLIEAQRACEELYISELEKELGVKLFEKQNRKIGLTEYGERVLPYVQKSLMIMDEGANVLKQMAGTVPLVIRLGYFHSISASLIPAIVEEVYREPENQEIRFHFTEDTSFDVFNQLKNGKLDLAFCAHRDTWACLLYTSHR